jgi:type IV secretion system protein VirB5
MRRMIMAGVCLTALCSQASAQGLLVNDPASILTEAKQLAQEAKAYLVQAQQYATQVQQYATEAQQLANFVHSPSLGGAMGLMNQAGLGNSLPVNPYALQNLTSGYGSLTSLSGVLGKLSQLNGLVSTNYAANHVYSPTDGSFSSQQLIDNGNAIAGVQGGAQSAYADLRTHLPIIQALRDRLTSATNMKDVADAQAQLAAETTWTQNLQSEITAMQVNYQAQKDARQQRDAEAFDQSIDNFLAKAKAAGRGL